MSEEYGYIQAFKYYRQSQSRFNYFFLGIILASFSLSIQTFDPIVDSYSVYLMVLTWSLLLVSFLSGLFRLERINMFLRVETDKLSFREKKAVFQKAESGEMILQKSFSDIWQPDEITNEISNLDSVINSSSKFIRTYNKQTLKAYQVQKWCFIFAILTFSLFKMTNIYHFKTVYEIISLILLIFVSIIMVKIYKKSLPFSDNKKIKSQPTPTAPDGE